MEMNDFEPIITFAQNRKYTSLSYVDYEDLKEAEMVVDEKTIKLLFDISKKVAEIHYACDDLQELISSIRAHRLMGVIKFIPYEAIPLFEKHGFKIHCAYQDYVLNDLSKISILLDINKEIQFATLENAKMLTALSKTCDGLSRGYFGETEEWFIEWLNENKVIVKVVEGEVVGFCCVSIYAEGTILWIRELAVRPDFQGKGIGKELLKMSLKYGLLNGAKKSFLAVDIENNTAIRLYEQFRFEAKINEIEVQMKS